MSKKECCCVPPGTYIAIPCRYAFVKSFYGNPPPGQGFNDYYVVHRENGDINGIPIGPFRFINGVQQFDSSREVVYMLRGAGGGGAGPYLPEIDNEKRHGLGGNGAYIQHKKNAELDDVARPGSGGAGGSGYTNSYALNTIRKRGGDSVSISGEGGDAAAITNLGSASAGEFSNFEIIAVAGGGGGGAIVDVAEFSPEIRGGRKGGNAGITLGLDGEDGYNRFATPPESGGGGGATNLAGGTAVGGDLPDNANRLPKNGTANGGGRGARINPTGQNITVGYGGGGGGGLYGGGGGNFNGGGGGASSFSNDTEYSFVSNDSYSANFCNPYMDPLSGVGGRQLPSNNFLNGNSGEIVEYYIFGFCECDPSKNILPDPLFICLNSQQREYIIDQAGEPPPPLENGIPVYYSLLFDYDGETYVLTGSCTKNCETPYTIPSTLNFSNIRYAKGGLGDPVPAWVSPPCCSQIVCQPLCPIEGAACANCGCEPFQDVLVCCNTENKPDSYYSIYNGWVYSCTKSNQNWIIPGQLTQDVITQCLEPITPTPQCSQDQNDCDETLSEIYEGCSPFRCQDGCNYSITVSSNSIQYQAYCAPDCIERSGAFSHTFNGGPGSYSFIDPGNTPCNPSGSFFLNWDFQQIPELDSLEQILEIEFDCVPPVDSNGAYPYFIPGNAFGATWIICDARVTVGDNEANTGSNLGEIVSALNSRLGGRVRLSTNYPDLFFGGTCGPADIESIVEDISTGKLIVKVYSIKKFVRACGNASINISAYPCTSKTAYSQFRGAPLNTWQMPSTLSISMCTCEDLFDPDGNPTYNSQYTNCCSTNPEIVFAPCGNLNVTG